MMNQSEANTATPRQLANADQEVWVQNRIRTAIKMAQAIYSKATVAAERDTAERAIGGVVQGTAVEIIRTLGMEPSWENLSRRENRS